MSKINDTIFVLFSVVFENIPRPRRAWVFSCSSLFIVLTREWNNCSCDYSNCTWNNLASFISVVISLLHVWYYYCKYNIITIILRLSFCWACNYLRDFILDRVIFLAWLKKRVKYFHFFHLFFNWYFYIVKLLLLHGHWIEVLLIIVRAIIHNLVICDHQQN